jgi:ubiquinone/menaquinone biosynthesis C-methylase UbiE
MRMLFASPAPSSRPGFFSFGYLPIGVPHYDIKGRLFGVPNLLKRLQAPDIMAALDIQPTDCVLDFGCGSGYMTVEMAKLAAKATGIDVNPHLASIKIPRRLAGRLEYVQTSGTGLPFADATFDRILASEVLPMIPEPGPFLAEITRVLKPGGRLVVVNGLGHPLIEQAYAANAPRLAALARRYPDRMPRSYAEYCQRFQAIAGTARTSFMTETEIVEALRRAGFAIESTGYSPRQSAGAWLSWTQFELYLRTGKVVSDRSFLPTFLHLLVRSAFDRSDYRGGLILVASPGR